MKVIIEKETCKTIMLNYFPKYFTSRAIYLYLAALMVISLLFFSHIMKWYWFVFGVVEVAGFFYFSNSLTKSWSKSSEKLFKKRIFVTALIVRLLWVVFSYFFYIEMTGSPFEFDAADSWGYYDNGLWIMNLLKQGSLKPYFEVMGSAYSDMGYSIYLGIIYYIFGPNVILVRILKAFLGAYTCILIYKLGTRNFGDSVGRIAAVLCMLMPNLIYYCGLQLKEIEMVFLVVYFVERADFAIRSKKLSFGNLILPIVLAGSLFFFRTVLGVTALFAFFTAVIFTPGRTLKGWKRIILVGWVLLAVAYFMGGRIATEVEEVWEGRHTNQKSSMEHRAGVEGGNEYAKYVSSAVFAPFILVIPFPTMIETPNQENMRLIHGGNYVKNVMAFFCIFALILLIKNKKWREHALIGSFLVGYLLIIAFSKFGGSERFHLPSMSFLLLFAAYGISQVTNKTKKYYNIYLIFLFFVLIVWSWFKLAGRGAI